jgi:hypothetical protein
MPVRSIPRSHRSVTGRQPVNGQRSVAVESSLERDFVLLCRFEADFICIEEQPVMIPVPGGRRYIPDFLVTWREPRPPDLVEVKYEADLAAQADVLRPKFSAAETYAHDRGWRFRVATDKDIRTPRLANATFLLPFHFRPADPGLALRLTRTLQELGSATSEQVLAMAFPEMDGQIQALPVLWHLIATFRVRTNLDKELTMTSTLTLEG